MNKQQIVKDGAACFGFSEDELKVKQFEDLIVKGNGKDVKKMFAIVGPPQIHEDDKKSFYDIITQKLIFMHNKGYRWCAIYGDNETNIIIACIVRNFNKQFKFKNDDDEDDMVFNLVYFNKRTSDGKPCVFNKTIKNIVYATITPDCDLLVSEAYFVTLFEHLIIGFYENEKYNTSMFSSKVMSFYKKINKEYNIMIYNDTKKWHDIRPYYFNDIYY
jgi:hypothetical protein